LDREKNQGIASTYTFSPPASASAQTTKSAPASFRPESAMILDPYGRILAETWKPGNDMVVADLDASLLEVSTGRRWIKTRRPELYVPLTVPAGLEQDTRTIRFGKKGV
jgi:hypothetical protein